MCKSKPQGGQRCAGHAKERMDALMAQGEESIRRLQRGEITMEAATALHAKVSDAMIDYASTLEGAAAFKEDLANGEALYNMTGDPDDAAANEDIRRLINDGALRANRNRWVENQWRADRHMQPLTTPIPLTWHQQQEADAEAAIAAQAAEAATQAQAARAADPFGLRAAATTPTGSQITPDALQHASDNALETSGYGQVLRDAGLISDTRDQTGQINIDQLALENKAAELDRVMQPYQPSPYGDPYGLRADNAERMASFEQVVGQRSDLTADTLAAAVSAEAERLDRHTTVVETALLRRSAVQRRIANGQPTMARAQQALDRIREAINHPRLIAPAKGFRDRRIRKAEIARSATEGTQRFGSAFTTAVEKYEGTFDARQIERAAYLLHEQGLTEYDGIFNPAAHGVPTTGPNDQNHSTWRMHYQQHTAGGIDRGTFANQFVAANLDSTLGVSQWSLQPDPSVSGNIVSPLTSANSIAVNRHATANGSATPSSGPFGVEMEIDFPAHLQMPERRAPGRLDRALDKVQFLSEDEVRSAQRNIWRFGI